MDSLIEYIDGKQELLELPAIYKTIEGLKNNELRYYLLFLNKKNDLYEVLNSTLEEYYPEDTYKISEICKEESMNSIKVTLMLKNKPLVSGIFILKGDSPFVYLMTDCGSNRNILEMFLKKLYPLIERVSIPSKKVIIEKIVGSLLEEGYTLTSSMVSEKKVWQDKSIKPAIDYPTGIQISEVLTSIEKNNAFINSILLNLFNEKGLKVCKFFISRKGILKFVDGSLKIFEEKILGRVLESLESVYRGLENREQKGDVIKPLKIHFEVEISNPKESILKFVELLRKNNEISLCTYHNGNPFFFADVSDKREGSFYGVMFESENSGSTLTILPQRVCSQIALSNFISYVSNEIGEGKLELIN